MNELKIQDLIKMLNGKGNLSIQALVKAIGE